MQDVLATSPALSSSIPIQELLPWESFSGDVLTDSKNTLEETMHNFFDSFYFASFRWVYCLSLPRIFETRFLIRIKWKFNAF